MSGIPIHTESPISLAKASAVTPQTTTAPAPTPSFTPATSTASAPQSYHPAQPGASAPAPTQAASQYTPSTQPTPTRTTATLTSKDRPPPPQPGAFPVPASSAYTTPKPNIPPPPKAGEKPHPPSYYEPALPTSTPTQLPQPYPPQTTFPPLSNPNTQGAQPPASLTYTTFNASHIKPTTLPFPAPSTAANTGVPGNITHHGSLQHPPGYVQNPYAADIPPQQFNTQQSGNHPFASGYNGNNVSSERRGSGILGVGGGGNDEDESVWSTVGKWAKGVGEKVGEMEGEVWKRINGEK
ncbi:hypothetical protein MMC24_002598 [Lignoscripta atroalba]|nr:hypothetical protein [Lignoscripta atroalba]